MNNVNVMHAGHALAPFGGAATVIANGTLSFIATNCFFKYNVAQMGAAIYLECTRAPPLDSPSSHQNIVATQALVDAVFKNTQFIGNAVTVSSGTGGKKKI